MSTRSSIAVQYEDGSVQAVYCHFDGYLKGVGETLVLNFDSLEKAKALVELGDLSTVAGAADLSDVVAYSRNRGESYDSVAPKKFASLTEYFGGVDEAIDTNGFHYVFFQLNDSNPQWCCFGHCTPRGAMVQPVEVALNQKSNT